MDWGIVAGLGIALVVAMILSNESAAYSISIVSIAYIILSPIISRFWAKKKHKDNNDDGLHSPEN